MKEKELDDEAYGMLMRNLGLDKMLRCSHIFDVHNTREAMGDFVRVHKVYKCIKCGITIEYRWCEHL